MIDNQQEADVFQWANQVDATKNELEIELFLFNRNYTPYYLSYSDRVVPRLKALFLYDIVNHVQMGAATGLAIKPFEKSEGESNTLEFTELENVQRAETLLYLINGEKDDIVHFNENEHEIKRMRGIVARFKAPTGEPFYIMKSLSAAQIMRATAALALSDDGVLDEQVSTSLRITPDNQVLIVGDRVFVFNEAKFISMFQYDARQSLVLANKIAEIEKHFKLVYPEGVTLEYLVDHSKQLTNKIMKVDPQSVTQDQVLEHADSFGVELMTDDAGAIIIMDARDALIFVNLLNDDYIESDMTGAHYLVKTKQTISESGDNQTKLDVR